MEVRRTEMAKLVAVATYYSREENEDSPARNHSSRKLPDRKQKYLFGSAYEKTGQPAHVTRIEEDMQ